MLSYVNYEWVRPNLLMLKHLEIARIHSIGRKYHDFCFV
jgi:hypothetical protein